MVKEFTLCWDVHRGLPIGQRTTQNVAGWITVKWEERNKQ